jgi:hypothetical protein
MRVKNARDHIKRGAALEIDEVRSARVVGLWFLKKRNLAQRFLFAV